MMGEMSRFQYIPDDFEHHYLLAIGVYRNYTTKFATVTG